MMGPRVISDSPPSPVAWAEACDIWGGGRVWNPDVTRESLVHAVGAPPPCPSHGPPLSHMRTCMSSLSLHQVPAADCLSWNGGFFPQGKH